MKSEFSVGLADKVCGIWDDEGGTPAELNSFAENNALVRVLLTIIRGGAVVKPLAVKPHVIPIDRSKPFDLATFIGKGWSVWRGPADSNGLEGEEERDLRSVTLTELDLNQVQLVTCFEQNEERISRLTYGRVRLDENAFKAFLENREQLPARFKERVNGNIHFILFDGVVLRGPDGRRCTLCLYFEDHDGSWYWICGWLGHGRGVNYSSAVLASQD